MIASMTPAGMLAGAILVGDALNTVTREAARQLLNETASEGILADGAMTVAEFMGFSRDVSLGSLMQPRLQPTFMVCLV